MRSRILSSHRAHVSPGIPATSRVKTPHVVRLLVWLIAVSLFELARRG